MQHTPSKTGQGNAPVWLEQLDKQIKRSRGSTKRQLQSLREQQLAKHDKQEFVPWQTLLTAKQQEQLPASLQQDDTPAVIKVLESDYNAVLAERDALRSEVLKWQDIAMKLSQQLLKEVR